MPEDHVRRAQKYYKTTEYGQKLLVRFLEDLLQLFEGLLISKMAFLEDELLEMTQFKPGMAVLDLSRGLPERFLTSMAPLIAPEGRWFVTSENQEAKEALAGRVEFLDLQDVVTVVEVVNGKTTAK